MNLKHKVKINILNRKGEKQRVLESGTLRLPKRLLRLLFGEFCEVLVLTPGASVSHIEIVENKGGADHE